jgi:Zn-dependent protease with chaperone function
MTTPDQKADQKADMKGGQKPDKKILTQISPRAFEHPLDRSAIQILQKVPGLDWVAKKFIATIGDKRMRLYFLASAVRVNENQFAPVHALFLEACRVLDIEEPPEVFVMQDFVVNAAAVGVDKPFIVLTSSLVETLSPEELQAVIAHELGHIMCGHALYTTLLIIILKAWHFLLGIPGGSYAVWALMLGLMEWSRKAELSADRAGLLVSQDLAVSHRVDMKLAGGKLTEQMSITEFQKQAEEYQAAGDVLDSVLKFQLLLVQSHPLPVLRVVELQKWVDSGDYQKILDGEYERRGDEPENTWAEDVKDTAQDYRKAYDDSQDPLVATLRDFTEGAAATGVEIFSFFRKKLTEASEVAREQRGGDDPEEK